MSEDDEEISRSFTILYGSQSGNAQDVAERLARQARRRRIQTSVLSMDEYDINDLINESFVVFIVSTTGNGDFPISSLAFWKFLLRSNLPADILCDLTYATFGLGDSSYIRYCWPSRKINKRLRSLGAHELIEGGEADDQHYLGIEGTLRPWMDKLWQTLDDYLPSMKAGETLIDDEQPLPPVIEVHLSESALAGPSKTRLNGAPSSSMPLYPGWQWARLSRNDRMTSEDHWQDVRLVELQHREGSQIEYEPGDVVCLMPENSEEDVERILYRMGWRDIADAPITLQASEIAQRLPPRLASQTNLTLRKLFRCHLDINSVPRPSFFEQLIPFTPADHLQREKLQEFCTPGDGSDEMYEYAIRVRRTILETLEEFDTVRIPISHLLEVFPLIQRREFSIASAPLQSPGVVQLAIAMVSYKTRLKERRKGVCSSWLSRMKEGMEVPIHITKSTTHLPSSPHTPAIFVGPGTGVAPIRSFLQQRQCLLTSTDCDGADGSKRMEAKDNLCFFGCRNKEKDWLFAEEWKEMEDKGRLDYHLAASRDQQSKVYVQNLIEQQGKKIWDMLANRQGYLYICGSSGKMPQAVRQAVVDIACGIGNLLEEQAEAFISTLEREGRWLEECWS